MGKNNWYITRRAAKEYIGIETTIKDSRIDMLIYASSRLIDNLCDRFFIPQIATKYYDYQKSTSELVLDNDDLISITSLKKCHDDGTDMVIAAEDILLYDLNKTPKNKIHIKRWEDYFAYSAESNNAISITGMWGYCNDWDNLGMIMVGDLTDSTASLVVTDGSKVDVGNTIKIDDEQMFLKEWSLSDSTANAAEDIDVNEEDINVSSGALLKVGEIIKIDAEEMKIISISTNTIKVFRHMNGTAPAVHSTSADIYVYRTFTLERAVNGTVSAAHVDEKTLYCFIMPAPLELVCGVLVARMDKRSDTAWADRTGTQESGLFYYKSLPEETKALLDNYRRVQAPDG